MVLPHPIACDPLEAAPVPKHLISKQRELVPGMDRVGWLPGDDFWGGKAVKKGVGISVSGVLWTPPYGQQQKGHSRGPVALTVSPLSVQMGTWKNAVG